MTAPENNSHMIAFDDRWDAFASRVPEAERLASMSDDQLARTIKVGHALIAKAVPEALREWRVSPSRSLVNCIAGAGDDVPSGHVFRTLADQTRFIIKAREAGILLPIDVLAVKDEKGKRIRLSQDACALTVHPQSVNRVNDIVRAFRAWELRNRAQVTTGKVRLPKVLYRAVRARDVDHDKSVGQDDRGYLHRWKDIVEAKIDAMTSNPLVEVSHSPLLSFTSNETVADYFTRNEGFVVSVDPAAVDVVAAWATDEALDGKDQVSGRHEREWILRIPPEMTLAPSDVRVHDADYMAAIVSPLSVALFHHNDKEALYSLDGHRIKASFYWNSAGTNGSLSFRVENEWGLSRAAVRKRFGFDPLPTPENISRVEDFRLFTSDWSGKVKPIDAPGAAADGDVPQKTPAFGR